jgi:hypothetical protein
VGGGDLPFARSQTDGSGKRMSTCALDTWKL